MTPNCAQNHTSRLQQPLRSLGPRIEDPTATRGFDFNVGGALARPRLASSPGPGDEALRPWQQPGQSTRRVRVQLNSESATMYPWLRFVFHPASPGRRGPKIEDLVVELKPVNWHKLGIQLGVPFDRLDKIDEDHQSSDRKLSEVLRYWRENDPEPSWEKICEALQRIGGFNRLVRELKMKYCSLS